MTYIVWFNRKYRRQFEAVIKDKTWKAYQRKYGVVEAAVILVSHLHRVKSKRHKTARKESSARKFIMGSYTRPDIFGSPIIKIGKSKKSVLDRGHSELAFKGVKPYAGREKTRRRLR